MQTNIHPHGERVTQSQTDNCFNLVGDGDDVSILENVKEAFGVEISDAEAASCETFGQLFDVVWDKVQPTTHIGFGCPNAIAFYRLRTSLRACGFPERITLNSDLNAFFRRNGAKKTHAKLLQSAGLKLPFLRLTTISTTILACILAVGAACGIIQSSWLPTFLAALLSASLLVILPRELRPSTANMRDFIRTCTALNFEHLTRVCGGARSHDVWNALALIVCESTGAKLNEPINRETRFFRSRA